MFFMFLFLSLCLNITSNDSTLLSYPKIKPKATLGERAFAFAAPKLWNALPRPIRESTSVALLRES